MTIENISWSISTKECCRPRWGLNPRPPGLQSDGASNWATEAGQNDVIDVDHYKPPWYFLPSFESIGLSDQEKKLKIDFQHGSYGDHLGFPIGTILAIFDLSHPNTSNQVSSQLVFPLRRRSSKKIFKMATVVAILDFRSKQDQLFLIYKSPYYCLPRAFRFRRRFKIDFQDVGHGGHLRFPLGTILAMLAILDFWSEHF